MSHASVHVSASFRENVHMVLSFFHFNTAASTVPDTACPNIYVSGIAPLH